MKQNQGIIIAIAIIGLLTLVNSYKLFFGSNNPVASIETADPALNTANQNNQVPSQGETFPNPNQPNANNPIATPESNLPKTAIKFEKNSHGFGKIKQNTENKYSFTFRNTGVEPLVISDAKGSCGCTVPNYPKDPIAPGASGKIDVVYSPGMQSGSQNKTVTITANTNPAQTILNITAEVQADPNAPKQESQPINITPAGN